LQNGFLDVKFWGIVAKNLLLFNKASRAKICADLEKCANFVIIAKKILRRHDEKSYSFCIFSACCRGDKRVREKRLSAPDVPLD
jgi:hypothetical protein